MDNVTTYHPAYAGSMYPDSETDKSNYVRYTDHIAKVAEMQAEFERNNIQRECAVATERKDCERALVTLAGAGVCTPEEGYGTNSSWAISDLCRAVTALREKLAEMTMDCDLWKDDHEGDCPYKQQLAEAQATIALLRETQINHDWWVKRGTELEATIARLQWRPITETDLPKVGDRVRSEAEAALLYEKAAIELHGEFARFK